MSKLDKEIHVSLDIGTSEIAAIVAETVPGEDNDLEIVGVGTSQSKGMKKGVVVNVQELSQAMEKAVSEAETMADCQISHVFAGISGTHITSISSHGLIAGPRREITQQDVNRALQTAMQYGFHGDYELLHAIPRSFKLDGMGGIREPVGMSGIRLETDVYLIACSVTALQNIRNCLQRCNLVGESIILEQIAASYACLSQDEMELGVCLVDIGGGTTDIAVFQGGAIQHTAVIPIAGDRVTHDVSVTLRTPFAQAEELKCRYGVAHASEGDLGEKIEVTLVGDQAKKEISRQGLLDVIQSRYEELFELVSQELLRHGFDEKTLVSGIVLTGGSAMVPGLTALGEEIFHLPVRRGKPRGIRGFDDIIGNPRYATAIGLLRYGVKEMDKDRHGGSTGGLRGIWDRVKKIF